MIQGSRRRSKDRIKENETRLYEKEK